MDEKEIWTGDFCEIYDSTGLRWTAFIERKYQKMGNGKNKFVDYFHSNWSVSLFDDWTRKQLRIIKKRNGR